MTSLTRTTVCYLAWIKAYRKAFLTNQLSSSTKVDMARWVGEEGL